MVNRLAALVEMAPEDKKARIHMLGEFIQGREKIIEDPIYVSLIFIFYYYSKAPPPFTRTNEINMRVSEVIIQSIVYSLNLAVNTVKGVASYIFYESTIY